MRTVSLILLLLCSSALLAEDAEAPVAITTTGGSRLQGMLNTERPLVFRADPAPGKPKGPPQKLDLANVKLLTFGERHDPNQENEALVALGDLQSDKFNVRDAALAKLRTLGRAAIRPLKTAANSADAEVANRARALLGELSVRNATKIFGDTVTLADGTVLSGEISPPEFTLRSRWGVLKFPNRCIESIEPLKAGAVDAKGLAAGKEAVAVDPPPVADDKAQAAERIENPFEFQQRQAVAGRANLLSGMTMLPMDKLPSPDGKDAAKKRTVDAKVGDRLEDAYASWGARMRATDPNAKIEVAEQPVGGVSNGFSAQLSKSDLNIDFVVPGSFSALSEQTRAGGVSVFGVFIKACPRFSIGLAAYDRSGRQLAEISNLGNEFAAVPNAPQGIGEFLGVRSKVPIASVRIFRMPEGKEEDIVFDDMIFDRVVSVERPLGISCAWLNSGERIAGQLDKSAGDKISLRAEFLNAKAAPVEVSLDSVERFEPAREVLITEPDQIAEKKRPMLGTPHGVLLQSGESFRACFLKLDDKDVFFMLPGGVEMKMPRGALRKIDLQPPAPEPGEIIAATSVAADEKPGVDFIRREETKKGENNEPPPEKKKNDILQTTQALKRMDDVKIVEANVLTNELTTEDENGPWTIGLAPVRTLVFPKDPNAQKAAPKFKDWVLTLREGSSFEISLQAISADSITAEMAGGTVSLPLHVIDSITRVKR